MHRRSRLPAAVLVAPAALSMLCFTAVPLALLVWLVLHDWNLLGPPMPVGLANATAVLSDATTWRSAGVTLAIAGSVVVTQLCLALPVALALERTGRYAGIYRTLLLLPWVAAPVASAALWRWLLAPEDGIPALLIGRRVDILAHPVGAGLAIISVLAWGGVGYSSLFFTAALRALPPECRDAARLDGASQSQYLRLIALPLMRPMLVFLTVTTLVHAATVFDTAYVLTGGGPDQATDVLALRIQRTAFFSFDIGGSAVLSLLLLIGLGAAVALQARTIAPGRRS